MAIIRPESTKTAKPMMRKNESITWNILDNENVILLFLMAWRINCLFVRGIYLAPAAPLIL
ncbi:hypothetical protein [Azospira oryzae]|uniref:hypothetical protein n=1 Tax=Azospira oryzae TaxID=146939 RepID=UPI0019644027|nr:hypothetical protein [Azospira oryzae]